MSRSIKRRLRFLFQEIDLAEGDFIIGRSPSCNLTLEDPLVSRHHARISVTAEGATIAELGSRNGTLINGEPLFDDHLLETNDRIRIGNHDIVYMEEHRFPSRPLKVTGALIPCPSCRAALAVGTASCPHCGARLPTATRSCPRCRLVGEADVTYCTRCGATFEPVDDTITLQMGGASAGWTAGMISAVIEKALRAGRYEHAARLLAGKVEDYELKAARGVHDVALLAEIAPVNARLAAALKEGARLRWIVDAYADAGEPMADPTLTQLLESARGWYNLNDDLGRYLRALEQSRPGGGHEPIARRLAEIVRR